MDFGFGNKIWKVFFEISFEYQKNTIKCKLIVKNQNNLLQFKFFLKKEKKNYFWRMKKRKSNIFIFRKLLDKFLFSSKTLIKKNDVFSNYFILLKNFKLEKKSKFRIFKEKISICLIQTLKAKIKKTELESYEKISLYKKKKN